MEDVGVMCVLYDIVDGLGLFSYNCVMLVIVMVLFCFVVDLFWGDVYCVSLLVGGGLVGMLRYRFCGFVFEGKIFVKMGLLNYVDVLFGYM